MTEESEMTTEQKLNSIEDTLKIQKSIFDRGIRMRKLWEIPEFKELILEDYCKEYAGALVVMRADPAMQTPERQDNLLKNLDGIGYMQQYMDGVVGRGNQAEVTIKQYEDEREYLLNEQSIN